MVVEQRTPIRNRNGFHIRPGGRFMAIANNYRARVRVFGPHEREANGRSAVELMSLGVHAGETIRIVAEGVDAEEALAALVTLVESRFGGMD